MYELHKLTSTQPVSFFDFSLKSSSCCNLHWHENIEIIHITKGVVKAALDSSEIFAKTGETITVNPNILHQFFAHESDAQYYCLIISIDFLKQMGLDFTKKTVRNLLCDNDITLLFSHIGKTAKTKPDYCDTELIIDALKIAILLARNYETDTTTSRKGESSAKTDIIKNAIFYIQEHFTEQITLEKVCKEIGVSKYYLCHEFKEKAHTTFTGMLNFLRCQEARRLLLNSEYTVQEAAYKCGFLNMSYFTKTYKAIMGHLPSEIKKKQNKS